MKAKSLFFSLLVALALFFLPASSFANGGWHGGGGGWHGGGWRGGGWGFGPGWGWGYARPYYGPYPYYEDAPATCGYVRVRVLRAGHWVFRRAWRCW